MANSLSRGNQSPDDLATNGHGNGPPDDLPNDDHGNGPPDDLPNNDHGNGPPDDLPNNDHGNGPPDDLPNNDHGNGSLLLNTDGTILNLRDSNALGELGDSNDFLHVSTDFSAYDGTDLNSESVIDGRQGADQILVLEDAVIADGFFEDFQSFSVLRLFNGEEATGTTVTLANTAALAGIQEVSGGKGSDAIVFETSAYNNIDVTVEGNDGDDLIVTAGGDDRLMGNAGADTLTGNAGNDRFVFNEVTDSAEGAMDIITDFKNGGDADVIDLGQIFAGDPSIPIDITNTSAALSGTSAEFGGNRIAYFDNGVDTVVYVDANGDNTYGAGDMQIQLTGTNLVLLAADFII